MERVNISKYFWGTFLVAFGGIILAEKYNLFYIDYNLFTDLWPALFILAGITVMVGPKPAKILLTVLFAVFISLLAASLFYGSGLCIRPPHFVSHFNLF